VTSDDAGKLLDETRPLWRREVGRVEVQLEHCLENGYSSVMLVGIKMRFRGDAVQRPSGAVLRGLMGLFYLDAVSTGVRLEEGGKILTAAFSGADLQTASYQRLLNTILSSIEITPPARDSVFHFSNGLDLRCFPCTSQCTPWEIELPSGDKLKLGAGSWSKS
jgi:hypothetical protein